MTVSGLEECLRFSFRWPFWCTARHDEDVFRMAVRVREEDALHPPMSRPGVEDCKSTQRTFFLGVKFGPVEPKPLSRGTE